MQQPPNDPQSWQQSQQPYNQYPQQPFGPPPGPLPKKSRRRLWIILSIIGGILVLTCSTCGLVAAFAPALKPTTQQSTPTVAIATATPTATQPGPTETPTTPPTAKPTIMPTATTDSGNLTATFGTPLLGGLITDFIGKYGTPDKTCPPYSLCWFHDGSTNAAGLIVEKHLNANGNYTTQVDWVTVQTINGQIWDSSAAADVCTVYNPTDAHQIKRIPLVNASGKPSGFDIVYLSTSLANEFTAVDFSDGNGGTVQRGSFDIQYLYKGDGTQNMDSCSILIGEQQTQG